MASEYYKWLARDVRPEEKRELTSEEKRRNWWHYHKVYVIAGIVCLLLALNSLWQTVQNARNAPDYILAHVGFAPLSADTAGALEQIIADRGADLSGNGRVEILLKEYLLPPEDAADERSAQRDYTVSMQLTMDIEAAQSMIFLLDDPEAFAETFPILVSAEPDGPLWYRWADCPVLAEAADPDLAIARRGLWKGEHSDAIDAALALFGLLTEGASGPE